MTRVLTTFAFGPHSDLLEVSLPTFAKYAARHGYDLFVPRQPSGFDRPWSWFKVTAITALLAEYETVLWLDADVVVLRHDADVAAECQDAPMGLVVHDTSDGLVPNCGVWVVRRAAADLLRSLLAMRPVPRSDCWWEQAALIAALGGDAGSHPVSVPPGPMWRELAYQWNPHKYDKRGIPTDRRFFHATMYPDRKAAMLAALKGEVPCH